MHIGQNCKVRWQTEQNSDVFIWHNAMIKSIEGDTITVIWEKGQWEGHESDRIPLDWVLVRDDITSVRNDIIYIKTRLESVKSPEECMNELKKVTDLLTEKLDGISTRLDNLNYNLQRHLAMHNVVNYDEVNFDMDQMRASLNSLGSVHMYSRTTSPNDEEPVRRYTSAPQLPVFGNYKKNKD
tara:strand:- start:74 stop:622 length:549 start_codon:yes stop_codon:yes gene_type:complete